VGGNAILETEKRGKKVELIAAGGCRNLLFLERGEEQQGGLKQTINQPQKKWDAGPGSVNVSEASEENKQGFNESEGPTQSFYKTRAGRQDNPEAEVLRGTRKTKTTPKG